MHRRQVPLAVCEIKADLTTRRAPNFDALSRVFLCWRFLYIPLNGTIAKQEAWLEPYPKYIYS